MLFLLDSTGSMADEIDQIKRTLLSISARVSGLPSQPDLRFGMVSYRDRGDEYVTRLFEFDADVGRFANTIRNVVADGGGDEPDFEWLIIDASYIPAISRCIPMGPGPMAGTRPWPALKGG